MGVALSLSDALSHGFPPDGFQDLCWLNLTLTQQDGRSAQGDQQMLIDVGNREVRSLPPGVFNTFLLLYYNDRLWSSGKADALSLRLVRVDDLEATLVVNNATWGDEYQVSMKLVDNTDARGLLYTGWGKTIGFGRGECLFALSLMDYNRKAVEIV